MFFCIKLNFISLLNDIKKEYSQISDDVESLIDHLNKIDSFEKMEELSDKIFLFLEKNRVKYGKSELQ